MLPEYEEYLEQEMKLGRTSLLTRYLGAHRIVMYDIPLYFIVMKNVCPGKGDDIDEKYDLKGSWVNRYGSKKNKTTKASRPKKNTNLLINHGIISSDHSLLEEDDEDDGDGDAEGERVTGDEERKSPSKSLSARKSDGRKYGKRSTVKRDHGTIEDETTPLFLDNDLQNCFLVHPDVANLLAAQLDRDTKFLESETFHFFLHLFPFLTLFFCFFNFLHRMESDGL
jgi:hypothetical protein